MRETRQQRRARERHATKQSAATFDRIHTRVVEADTIGHMWRVYSEERFKGHGLEPEHLALLREVFYSGVAAMLELMNRVSGEDVSEDRGVEMLARLHEELDVYTKGLQ